MQSDQRNPARCQQGARQLPGRRPLSERQHRQGDGEEGLELQQKRGQPGAHAELHSGEKKGKLRREDKQAIGRDQPERIRRSLHEEDPRKGGQGKARDPQPQRGNLSQAELNDGEVHAPHENDGEGRKEVAQPHRSYLSNKPAHAPGRGPAEAR